ncbi:MAG TPA: tripartite tricarboxylate transporter substrate binding protein [Ramlibacter sp.]|nr:tripartite tricarboxylate transporter substrate binding protein [Ramlibacter sp.]
MRAASRAAAWTLGLAAVLANTAALAADASDAAQRFPERPVKIITGYASGGIGSQLARMFGEELSRRLKTPVVVEDRPGASNTIGARAAMAAPPDGHTLHVGAINSHPLLFKGGVDLASEMEPVATVALMPLVIVTSATQSLRSVAEVVAYAKANPGRLDFASSGGGAQHNLFMGLFASRAGIRFTHVPYRSAGDIQTGLARGDVHLTLLTAPSALPILAGGRAHAVMIGAAQRSPLLPDVPTPAQVGLKPFTADTLLVLWAPKGTPRPVIDKLSQAAMAINRDPAYAESIKARTGTLPLPLTPDETREQFAGKVHELMEAIRVTGYQPE